MYNIAMFLPDRKDPTSIYRAKGPFSLLRKQMGNINPYEEMNLDYVSSLDVDIAFVQRPALAPQLQCIHMFKEFGVPVWVDYDDDYINPTESNPRKSTELELRMTHVIKECLKAADVVTVTNEHLKSIYAEFNSNIVVVPNAQDDRLLSLQKEKIDPRNVILWRGNDKQRRDILKFDKQIMQVYRNNDTNSWNWMFMGYDPETIFDAMVDHDPKRVQKRPGNDFLEYYRQLTDINWGIMIKPLEDTVFNKSRSNITWQEACLSGAACLVPNWSSWTDYSDPNSIVTYDSPDDFKDKLTWLIKNPNEIIDRVIKGRKYIKENLMLSQINLKRRDIINKLMGEFKDVERIETGNNRIAKTSSAEHTAALHS